MCQVSLQVLRFYPVSIIPPIPILIFILYHYLKDMRAKPGNLQSDAPSRVERVRDNEVLWHSEFGLFTGTV
jgi:hypothetical protein